MNYTEILNQLKEASSFDLYRLNTAIRNEMESPERMYRVRQSFKEGDTISYFNSRHNSLIEAIVLQKKQQTVLVRNLIDQEQWNIRYYSINIARVPADIQSEKLTKNNLCIGECVGFNHDGTQIFGVIVRLNRKSVSLKTKENKHWVVGYSHLYKVIDADIIDGVVPKPLIGWVKNINPSLIIDL